MRANKNTAFGNGGCIFDCIIKTECRVELVNTQNTSQRFLSSHNRYKTTDEKPTNQSRLNPSKREYPRLNRKPQKARKNLVNHGNNVTKITKPQT